MRSIPRSSARGFTVALTALLGILAPIILAQDGGEPAGEELTTVILVRHAEKSFAEGDPDPALVPEGAERARKLAYILGSLDVDAIYSTDRKRTTSTAAPLAGKLGLEVRITPYSESYVADMARKIRQEHAGHVVVVVGHSNTTPGIARALGARDVPDIPESDYDNLFVVTFSKSATPRFLNLRF